MLRRRRRSVTEDELVQRGRADVQRLWEGLPSASSRDEASALHELAQLHDLLEASLQCGDASSAQRAAALVFDRLSAMPEDAYDDLGSSARSLAHYALAAAAVWERQFDKAGDQLVASAIPYDVGRSFGPRVAVANELLRKGRPEPVVAYLDAWAQHWKPRHIRRWVAAIQAGDQPTLVSPGDIPVANLGKQPSG